MTLTTAIGSLVLALTVATGTWPVGPDHEVVHDFAPPSSQWGSGHRGVDLLGSVGQPVHAALAGRVSYAGKLAGRGVVVVDHGATRTTYEPVTASVKMGAQVSEGAWIGVLQAVPGHCWPAVCLHWGLIRGETYLDPLSLVGAVPVRLLPLGPMQSGGGNGRWPSLESGATDGGVPPAPFWSPSFVSGPSG